MRASGLLDHATGLERADHVCWAYANDAALDEAAFRFLAAGLERGERLVWIGDGAADRLRRAPGPLADVDGLRARRDLRVMTVAEAHRTTAAFAPEQQLAFYDDATRTALADGYRGLRAVADVTTLAADPHRGADCLRWEHLCDDYVANGPGLAVLCGYSVRDVPTAVLADAAALHPVTHTPLTPPPFRLWFEGQRIIVAGEVDAFCADRFQRLLETTHLTRAEICLDLGDLDFIDLAGCRVVGRWAAQLIAASRTLQIAGSSRLFQRMWQVLDLTTAAGISFA